MAFLDSLLRALLYYIFKQHLSAKPSVHLHSTAKKTKQLPDLPVCLQTTFFCPSPSQPEFPEFKGGGEEKKRKKIKENQKTPNLLVLLGWKQLKK